MLSLAIFDINYQFFPVLLQNVVSVEAAIAESTELAPSLLVKRNFDGSIKEVFLICERQVLCKITPELSPLYLLAAFYAFNMKYPKGLHSLYTLFQIILLNSRPKKVPAIVSKVLTLF